MGVTVEQVLNELEKPKNQSEIKHLVHLKNLSNLDGLKQRRGAAGLFSKVAIAFAKKHVEALMILSECKTSADITAFKQTKHYDKIKSTVVGEKLDIKDLAKLEELHLFR